MFTSHLFKINAAKYSRVMADAGFANDGLCHEAEYALADNGWTPRFLQEDGLGNIQRGSMERLTQICSERGQGKLPQLVRKRAAFQIHMKCKPKLVIPICIFSGIPLYLTSHFYGFCCLTCRVNSPETFASRLKRQFCNSRTATRTFVSSSIVSSLSSEAVFTSSRARLSAGFRAATGEQEPRRRPLWRY